MTRVATPGTPSWLGSMNDRTVLQLALEEGVVTRSQLHRLTGLSKPTTTQVINRLMEAGLVYETGPIPGRRGPSAIGYAVHPDLHLGVAIDVSAEHMTATIVDTAGNDYPVIEEERVTGAEDSAQDMLDRDGGEQAISSIGALVRKAAKLANKDPQKVKHLLLGIPGSIIGEDEFWGAEALEPWPKKSLGQTLSSALGVTVHFERDVYLAAAAEAAAACGEGPSFVSYLWMGNGLGLVTIVDGEPLTGARGLAGEVGFLPVPARPAGSLPYPDFSLDLDTTPGPKEGQPLQLQDVIGGRQVANLARKAGLDVATYTKAIKGLNAQSGDDFARTQVLEFLGPWIAQVTLSSLFMLNPSTLILGGPTGDMGGADLAALVQKEVAAYTDWNITIEPSRVGASAPLEGARNRLLEQVRQALLDRAGPTPPQQEE